MGDEVIFTPQALKVNLSDRLYVNAGWLRVLSSSCWQHSHSSPLTHTSLNPNSASHAWHQAVMQGWKVCISCPEKNASTYVFCWQAGCICLPFRFIQFCSKMFTLLHSPSNQISLNGWFEIQQVDLSSLRWLAPHLHSSTNTGTTERNRWKPEPSSTCTIIFTYSVREGKVEEMHLTDCIDAPQDYNTGQVPGLTGLHILKLITVSSHHLN